VLLAITYRSG